MKERLYSAVKAAGRSSGRIREGSVRAIHASSLESETKGIIQYEKHPERDNLAISTELPCQPMSKLLENGFFLPPVQRDVMIFSHRKCLEDSIGYHFKDLSVLKEAFLAAGASNLRKDVSGRLEGNKRLAFVGDSVLRLLVADEWFPSGKSTETASKLLEECGSNERLSDVAKIYRLQDYLIRNPSQQGEEGRTTLASTAEALIGAVWIDSEKNFVVTRRVVKKLGLFRTP